MKYVLRNRTTGQYLKGAGEWVLGIDEAMNFDDAGEAREFSQAYRLDDVQPVQLVAPYLMSLLAVASGPAISGS
jgi:predicted secreted protein